MVGIPHRWLSPSLSVRQWKTMTDKTLKVRSSVLCCTTAPLHQAWLQAQLRLSSAAALDHSAGLSSTRFCHLFRATSQSHVRHFSEPVPGVTSWGSGKVLSGGSRGWSLQGQSQQLGPNEERETKMALLGL